jgi:hypothetical protein
MRVVPEVSTGLIPVSNVRRSSAPEATRKEITVSVHAIRRGIKTSLPAPEVPDYVSDVAVEGAAAESPLSE